MKKVGIFADVQNIYYTCRQDLRGQFNYRAFFEHTKQHAKIEHAFAYAISRQDDQQIKFQDALRHIGFEVKLKPFIQRQDGSAKGDWDVGITVDIMHLAAQLDHIILLSGDGDFSLLLQHVKQHFSLSTEVVSVENLTAKSLIDSADTYTPITSTWLK